MEEWFTIEKINADTFAISEYKHWEETHCYLLCGTEKDWLSTNFPISLSKKRILKLIF